MLLSMTGHGEAVRERDGLSLGVEVRTVNNRYLKVMFRGNEALGSLETDLEAVVRRFLRRGSVTVQIRLDREACADDFHLNEVVLTSYWKQLQAICERTGSRESLRLDALLTLPGVVIERASSSVDDDGLLSLIEEALAEALERLTRMRAEEGAAMQADLEAHCGEIEAALLQIRQRAPHVVDCYRRRLHERLNGLLEQLGVSVQEGDIVREVGLFADRCDIAEELVRLGSHLGQFREIVAAEESNGRKLEFVIQELLRETNTIGAKAGDAEIARAVVEIKTAIERMREMIQNVE